MSFDQVRLSCELLLALVARLLAFVIRDVLLEVVLGAKSWILHPALSHDVTRSLAVVADFHVALGRG